MTLIKKAEDLYKGESGKNYHFLKYDLTQEGYSIISKFRAKKLQKFIKFSDNVLEYGIGYGWNLAKIHCSEKVGYDVAKNLSNLVISKGIKFISDSKNIPKNNFDKVICHHTLEHVENPADVLREIKQYLKKKGVLLLYVPYEYNRRYLKFSNKDEDHHLYSWNIQTLGNLLSICNYEIINARVSSFGYERFAAKISSRFNTGFFGFKIIRLLLLIIRPVKEIQIIARVKN